MRDNNGDTFINQDDLDKWCNCSNFPYTKCDSCHNKLGDVIKIETELKLN